MSENNSAAQVADNGGEAASAPLDTQHKDVVMVDAVTDQASPMPTTTNTTAPRNGTLAAQTASRAPSAPTDLAFDIPSEAASHGDSTRRYLNTKVTGALLEGMRMLAKEQPDEPLRVLGEYLIQRSKELETGN